MTPSQVYAFPVTERSNHMDDKTFNLGSCPRDPLVGASPSKSRLWHDSVIHAEDSYHLFTEKNINNPQPQSNGQPLYRKHLLTGANSRWTGPGGAVHGPGRGAGSHPAIGSLRCCRRPGCGPRLPSSPAFPLPLPCHVGSHTSGESGRQSS